MWNKSLQEILRDMKNVFHVVLDNIENEYQSNNVNTIKNKIKSINTSVEGELTWITIVSSTDVNPPRLQTFKGRPMQVIQESYYLEKKIFGIEGGQFRGFEFVICERIEMRTKYENKIKVETVDGKEEDLIFSTYHELSDLVPKYKFSMKQSKEQEIRTIYTVEVPNKPPVEYFLDTTDVNGYDKLADFFDTLPGVQDDVLITFISDFFAQIYYHMLSSGNRVKKISGFLTDGKNFTFNIMNPVGFLMALSRTYLPLSIQSTEMSSVFKTYSTVTYNHFITKHVGKPSHGLVLRMVQELKTFFPSFVSENVDQKISEAFCNKCLNQYYKDDKMNLLSRNLEMICKDQKIEFPNAYLYFKRFIQFSFQDWKDNIWEITAFKRIITNYVKHILNRHEHIFKDLLSSSDLCEFIVLFGFIISLEKYKTATDDMNMDELLKILNDEDRYIYFIIDYLTYNNTFNYKILETFNRIFLSTDTTPQLRDMLHKTFTNPNAKDNDISHFLNGKKIIIPPEHPPEPPTYMESLAKALWKSSKTTANNVYTAVSKKITMASLMKTLTLATAGANAVAGVMGLQSGNSFIPFSMSAALTIANAGIFAMSSYKSITSSEEENALEHAATVLKKKMTLKDNEDIYYLICYPEKKWEEDFQKKENEKKQLRQREKLIEFLLKDGSFDIFGDMIVTLKDKEHVLKIMTEINQKNFYQEMNEFKKKSFVSLFPYAKNKVQYIVIKENGISTLYMKIFYADAIHFYVSTESIFELFSKENENIKTFFDLKNFTDHRYIIEETSIKKFWFGGHENRERNVIQDIYKPHPSEKKVMIQFRQTQNLNAKCRVLKWIQSSPKENVSENLREFVNPQYSDDIFTMSKDQLDRDNIYVSYQQLSKNFNRFLSKSFEEVSHMVDDGDQYNKRALYWSFLSSYYSFHNPVIHQMESINANKLFSFITTLANCKTQFTPSPPGTETSAYSDDAIEETIQLTRKNRMSTKFPWRVKKSRKSIGQVPLMLSNLSSEVKKIYISIVNTEKYKKLLSAIHENPRLTNTEIHERLDRLLADFTGMTLEQKKQFKDIIFTKVLKRL